MKKSSTILILAVLFWGFASADMSVSSSWVSVYWPDWMEASVWPNWINFKSDWMWAKVWSGWVDIDIKRKYDRKKELIEEHKDMIKEKIEDFDEKKRENIDSIIENWQKFYKKMWGLREYFRVDLSEEEKWEIKVIMQKYKEETKLIIEEYKDDLKSWDGEEIFDDMLEEFVDLTSDAFSELEVYIDEDYNERYELFVNEMIETIKQNSEYRQNIYEKWMDLRDKIKKKRNMLSEKLRKMFVAKLDQIPDSKKEEIFNKILDRIESKYDLISESDMSDDKKQRLLSVLDEVKEIVESKLSELESDDTLDEEDILEELFEWL